MTSTPANRVADRLGLDEGSSRRSWLTSGLHAVRYRDNAQAIAEIEALLR